MSTKQQLTPRECADLAATVEQVHNLRASLAAILYTVDAYLALTKGLVDDNGLCNMDKLDELEKLSVEMAALLAAAK